jgi:hypothetical protein
MDKRLYLNVAAALKVFKHDVRIKYIENPTYKQTFWPLYGPIARLLNPIKTNINTIIRIIYEQ